MRNKISNIIAAGLLALTAHSQAFDTTLNLDIYTPITSPHASLYTLKVGTYQGALSSDPFTAFGQLSANFNTAYTVSNLRGAEISGDNIYSVIEATVASPYSTAAGYDNSVYYWIADQADTTFALLKGVDTYWWDGKGLGSTDTFGIAGDSVTALFGSIDTSAGVNGGLGSIATTATGIPEPTSGSLFLVGAAGVLALRRLRKTNV
ncbi:MAG: PEP-CTERM sorting domain-containing protein [Bacteroidetes bacterium]|nr:PEP-CTERM sorting domain-containing protein [Bacteroidota bacterium]